MAKQTIGELHQKWWCKLCWKTPLQPSKSNLVASEDRFHSENGIRWTLGICQCVLQTGDVHVVFISWVIRSPHPPWFIPRSWLKNPSPHVGNCWYLPSYPWRIRMLMLELMRTKLRGIFVDKCGSTKIMAYIRIRHGWCIGSIQDPNRGMQTL